MGIVSTRRGEGEKATILSYQHSVYSWVVPGKPIPAPRLTQATAHHPVIPAGYYAFKAAVRAALLDTYPGEGTFALNIVSYGWPFRFPDDWDGMVAILDYSLWMPKARTGRCRHGDPDNIVKAISDSLFGDDRHVLPRCLSLICGSANPHVAIVVTICP